MRKNIKANMGILGAIILVITVMFSVIIASMVFFAFGESAGDAGTTYTITQAVTDDEVNQTIALTAKLDQNANYTAQRYNGTSGAWEKIAAGNVVYSEGTNSINITAYTADSGPNDVINSHHTYVRAIYHARSYTSIQSVITYAVIVFVMAAIVPLIIVGGVMLKSLGYFGGGGAV